MGAKAPQPAPEIQKGFNGSSLTVAPKGEQRGNNGPATISKPAPVPPPPPPPKK
jgi:hypothetical protein